MDEVQKPKNSGEFSWFGIPGFPSAEHKSGLNNAMQGYGLLRGDAV
jgi:hypothetical protein